MQEPIIINFAEIKSLDESFVGFMFGAKVESLLKAMFGGYSIPVTVKGTQNQISSFANTLNKEKDFLSTAKKYGLDNPVTYRNKFKLDSAIQNFERATGIEWPLR